MNYGNILPVTGGAGALVLGHMLGLDDIIAAAIATVLFGIAAYRYGSRIGRARTTILLAASALATTVATTAHILGLPWSIAAAAGLAAAVAALAAAAKATAGSARAVA